MNESGNLITIIQNYFENLFVQNSDSAVAMSTEVKSVIVIVIVAAIIFGITKKLTKVIAIAITLFVAYIVISNLGII